VEAMMSGLPVIATRSGGPESYIQEFNGLVLEQPELEIMQQAFLSLYHGYKNYQPEVIRNYALEHFSETAVSRQLIEAYTSLVKAD
jgi:glycosyltransferase involved in cell wall biosynthesis